MTYDNYIELYEAVYLFDRINQYIGMNPPAIFSKEAVLQLGVDESIYTALMRILTVNNLLELKDNEFVMTEDNEDQYKHILNDIIKKDPNKQYPQLYDKAINPSQFFFDTISESEYEIYSRCNFPHTFQMGKGVASHLDLSNSRVIELGGNSGGLGTALLSSFQACHYTVLDMEIPCRIGNEFKEINESDIIFMEGNVFDLSSPNESYDYIVIMNLLHDFDDSKSIEILKNSLKLCHNNTKFLIIEDVLTDDFEPKEVIMHGLRLSVECRGGKQRTIEEFKTLFGKINYKIEKTIQLNSVHTMLVMGRES